MLPDRHNHRLFYYLRTVLKGGQPAWFIVKAFDMRKFTLLQKMISKNQPYDLRDYAEIIYAGHSTSAPKEILKIANEKFGTNFTGE